MERCHESYRSESQVLLSVLEAFRHDPLVEWTKEKRRRSRSSSTKKRSRDMARVENNNDDDEDNSDARRMCCSTSMNVFVVCTIAIRS